MSLPLVRSGHRIASVAALAATVRRAGGSALGRLLRGIGGLLGLLPGRLADRGGGAKHAVGELALGVQELGGEVEHRVHDLGRGGQLAGAVPGGLGGAGHELLDGLGPGAHAVDDSLLALAEAVEHLRLELLGEVLFSWHGCPPLPGLYRSLGTRLPRLVFAYNAASAARSPSP